MEFMKKILGGQTYWHINKLSDITGNFQAPQRATCILGFADEAYFGGNACETNSLKTTITEETITVNIKNIPQFQIRSFLNLVVCSNDRKMIPAGRGPRRFQCMETADTYAGAETDVTRAYYKRIRAIDVGKFAAFLAQRDLSDFSSFRIIETEELKNQQQHSLPPMDRWWLDILEREEIGDGAGVWTREISNDDLNDNYDRWCTLTKTQYAFEQRKSFLAQMRKLLGMHDDAQWKGATNKKVASKGSDAKKNGLKIPTIVKCKKAFNCHVGTTMFSEADHMSDLI
jgi:hypothetical protein